MRVCEWCEIRVIVYADDDDDSDADRVWKDPPASEDNK